MSERNPEWRIWKAGFGMYRLKLFAKNTIIELVSTKKLDNPQDKEKRLLKLLEEARCSSDLIKYDKTLKDLYKLRTQKKPAD